MKRKDLGQHFLVDNHIISDELWYAGLSTSDVVLEIGPGQGALTIPLSKKVKQVIAIEKDKSLLKELAQIIPKNVMLIQADAVSYDFTSIPHFTKIISNLPYKISSPITFKLLSYPFEKAILMYQKEFAERMIAPTSTKQYSRLSIGVYYFAHCRLLKRVSKMCFSPPPKIDSYIVELIPRRTPPFELRNEAFFFDLVTHLFNHRRKKINTIIKHIYSITNSTISFGDERVETLTPEQIGNLSNTLFSLIHES